MSGTQWLPLILEDGTWLFFSEMFQNAGSKCFKIKQIARDWLVRCEDITVYTLKSEAWIAGIPSFDVGTFSFDQQLLNCRVNGDNTVSCDVAGRPCSFAVSAL